jgi:formylglycine-generating enzyme required for sulfatase activity
MGGTFKRQNAVETSVSTYRLDKYEVTIGRYRAFVDAVLAGYTPPAGSGKHTHLAAGGLTNRYDADKLESGWDTAWNAELPADKTTWSDVDHLSCTGSLWTANPRTDENKPVGCVNWFQAYAFCIWDGGFLPSYIEMNYALMGGDLERPHPWGAEPIAPDRATYCATDSCDMAMQSDVGSKPPGDGFFGQSDLVGSVWEWVYDGNNGAEVCKDCIFVDGASTLRSFTGGGYDSSPVQLETDYMLSDQIDHGVGNRGVRCARSP